MNNDFSVLTDLTSTLLHTLLDRYEQPDRQTVVRVRLNEQAYPAYFSSTDAHPRQATNTALQHLAGRGIIRLRWQKWEQGNWLTAVDLVPEQAPALYTFLQRTPRQQHAAELQALLAAQTPVTAWHAAFLTWVEQQLAEHRSVTPLTLDNSHWNRDLLAALAALARLQHPTSERTLSVRLFADSKRLAELRSAMVTVLRRCDPAAAEFGDDDRALLQAYLLERIPEYIPLAGPLLLQISALDGATPPLDLRTFERGIALPTSTLQTCTVSACTATTVLTIENATSFHEALVVRPPSMLTLFSGGFASPATLDLLRAIGVACPDIVFYHWGDIDPGGLRILAHLRGNLGTVHPLAMDIPTFEQYRQHVQPLTPRDRSTLKSLHQHPLLTDCYPLIAHMLATGYKLEQEAVTPPVMEKAQTKNISCSNPILDID